MRTFSTLITFEAVDGAAAQEVLDGISAELQSQRTDGSHGPLLKFDAQRTIDDLVEDLTRIGFGTDDDIDSTEAVDAVNDHFTELSLMSSEDHSTNV